MTKHIHPKIIEVIDEIDGFEDCPKCGGEIEVITPLDVGNTIVRCTKCKWETAYFNFDLDTVKKSYKQACEIERSKAGLK